MAIAGAFLLPHPPMIVPRVGEGREREIRATADSCARVGERIKHLQPDALVMLSPHATMYADYIHIAPGKGARGSLARFGAPDVTCVTYDTELVRTLEGLCASSGIPGGTLGEKDSSLDHGTLVPLHFLGPLPEGCRVVRISPSGLSRLDHYRFGSLLQQACCELGRRAVVVASGDLSHKLREDGPYGFAPEGPELDAAITAAVGSGDFRSLLELDETLCERGAECGLLPLIMLAGALDGLQVKAELLSYEGPFGVGYAVGAFETGAPDVDRCLLEALDREERQAVAECRAGEDAYVALARTALETYVRTGKRQSANDDGLSGELVSGAAGVFVCIKKRGELRGCIGTTGPTQPTIAEEIRCNAVSAGTRDPRFAPVQAAELDLLTYHVDILGEPEPCRIEDLDPARYGVVVSQGARRGLLLPDLEGVDTVSRQVDIALRKAGILPGSSYEVERFEVERHR